MEEEQLLIKIPNNALVPRDWCYGKTNLRHDSPEKSVCKIWIKVGKLSRIDMLNLSDHRVR